MGFLDITDESETKYKVRIILEIVMERKALPTNAHVDPMKCKRKLTTDGENISIFRQTVVTWFIPRPDFF